jgi:hypothetical protein
MTKVHAQGWVEPKEKDEHHDVQEQVERHQREVIMVPREVELPMNFFSLSLVRAASTSNPLVKITWPLASTALIFTQIICLWSVIVSSSWKPCLEMSDCMMGQACMRSPEMMTNTCEDCSFPYGEDAFVMPPSGLNDPEIGNITLKAYCMNQLDAAHGMGLVVSKEEYDETFCLFVVSNYAKITLLSKIVMWITFTLVSAACVVERQQQTFCKELRPILFPISGEQSDLLTGTFYTEPMYKRPARMLNILCAVIYCLNEALSDTIVLTLIPTAMVILLLNTSLNAVDILLNGVAIAFVIEIDDLMVDNMLTYRGKAELNSIVEDMVENKPIRYV